jgi:SulP family sulfate permease
MILLVAAPLAKFIPLATLAAVLFVVAYNMGEWREIGGILRLGRAERVVWVATFGLTVVADLTVAVEVGMTLAALLYIYRVSQTTTIAPVTDAYIEKGRPHVLQGKDIPKYVTILRIHGPFLFGTTEKLADATNDLSQYGHVVILRVRNMTAIDATGLYALEKLAERLHKTDRHVLVCGARRQPRTMLERADFVSVIGQENILPHVDAALARARILHHFPEKRMSA